MRLVGLWEAREVAEPVGVEFIPDADHIPALPVVLGPVAIPDGTQKSEGVGVVGWSLEVWYNEGGPVWDGSGRVPGSARVECGCPDQVEFDQPDVGGFVITFQSAGGLSDNAGFSEVLLEQFVVDQAGIGHASQGSVDRGSMDGAAAIATPPPSGRPPRT